MVNTERTRPGKEKDLAQLFGDKEKAESATLKKILFNLSRDSVFSSWKPSHEEEKKIMKDTENFLKSVHGIGIDGLMSDDEKTRNDTLELFKKLYYAIQNGWEIFADDDIQNRWDRFSASADYLDSKKKQWYEYHAKYQELVSNYMRKYKGLGVGKIFDSGYDQSQNNLRDIWDALNIVASYDPDRRYKGDTNSNFFNFLMEPVYVQVGKQDVIDMVRYMYVLAKTYEQIKDVIDFADAFASDKENLLGMLR